MTIVDQAKLYAIDYFGRNKSEKLKFHSIEHTLNVVGQAELICHSEKISNEESQAVLVACWFHDLGYFVRNKGHEDESKKIVRSFFEEHPVDPSFAELVERCIEATKRLNEPKSLPEQIIMDADVSHIGFDNFITISKKLRKEISLCYEKEIPAREYWEKSLAFLNKQVFYTPYAKQNYEPVKEKNIIAVRSLAEKAQPEESEKPGEGDAEQKKREHYSEKGIQSMFRLTASNQMRLSMMADRKANILISINSTLISLIGAAVSRGYPATKQYIASLTVLFVACLLSLVFSILSVRPKLTSQKVDDDEIKHQNVNLLFFGNFRHIDFSKYQSLVKEMMRDTEYLYSNLIRDQYFLGLSLTRKYKLLRFSYNFFMFGFIIAALVFTVIFASVR